MVLGGIAVHEHKCTARCFFRNDKHNFSCIRQKKQQQLIVFLFFVQP